MTEQTMITGRKRLQPIFRPLIHPLIEEREKRGISQFELEHKIGVTRGYLTKWECGLRTPSLYSYICWAEALDLGIGFYPLDDPDFKKLIVSNDNGELIGNDNLQGDMKSPELPYSI